MGIVRADSTCGFLGIGGGDCKEKRDGVRTVCGPLLATNLNLYEACVANQNIDDATFRAKSTDSFLCNTIGGETLFKMYGIEGKCGYNPFQDGNPEKDLLDETNKRNDAQNDNIFNIIKVVLLIIVAIVVWLIL